METAKVGTLNPPIKEENNDSSATQKKYTFIPHAKYSTDIAQYELISPICGVDDISYLYLALYIPTNEFVALKYTDLTISIDYALITELENTIINTHLLKHPNILPYYTDFIENDRLWTVTYPMKAGACSTILKDYFPDGFSELMTSSILKEVLKALYYLHSNNLVHNDIRASNILLDFNGDVKLTGYHQLSSLVVGGKLKKSIFTPIGDNHEWAAPEIIAQNTSHNHKSDIYSIGITALELVYNKTPFDDWPSAKILLSKIMYAIPMIKSEKKLSKNFWSFVSACVRKDPKERPDVSELLEMPFIKKAKNTHFIETVLKKSGIINKHTAAIESVMQNMAEITEKARQAQCLDIERTQAYNEELKRQQLMAIFSSNYSFNIDDLEITDIEGMENIEVPVENDNPTSGDVENENFIDVDSQPQTQAQSSQTIKTESIISQNQQQTLQSNNQQLTYTNPNSRSIPNSKSQGSSLKYISSHSLIKQGQPGQGISSSQNSSQIKQDKLASSKSNSVIMGKSEDSRSRILSSNSKSNSMLMNNKNENESRSKIMRMNSKHSSMSIVSNTQMTINSKQNSQKLIGSEVFELVRDTSQSRDKNIERNNSYNLIKENSVKHLIKEEDEDEVKALNESIVSKPVYVNYQISQPNILADKVPPLEPESKISNHSTPLLKDENLKPASKKRISTNAEGNRSSILAIGNRLSAIMVKSSSDVDNSRMKKSVSFTVSKNESLKEVNNEVMNYDNMILKTSVIK